MQRLAEAGAHVIKVEPPAGDPMRHLAAAWYRRMHRDVTVHRLDLKSEAGRSRLDGWLSRAQVLITSQRPSALARLALTPKQLTRRHPHLRGVHIVGSTAAPETAGHDLTYQAETGLLADGRMPASLLADLFGAERVVSTVLLALLAPAPDHRHVGLRDSLDTAILPPAHGLTASGGPLGGGNPMYAIYEARHGYVALAALEPHFAARVITLAGSADSRILTRLFRTRTARYWEAWARRHDVPLVAIRGKA